MNIQTYGPHGAKQTFAQVDSNQTSDQKGNFAEILKQYASETNQSVKAANKKAETLAVTGEGNMSETLLAVKQADLSFQLMLSARNKVMDAYREIIRMQV